jgi:hypothetical protein
MAARKGQVKAAKQSKTSKAYEEITKEPNREKTQKEVVEEHLPPLLLTIIVLLCSGGLLMFSMRDAISTGKNIAGSFDEAMLVS